MGPRGAGLARRGHLRGQFFGDPNVRGGGGLLALLAGHKKVFRTRRGPDWLILVADSSGRPKVSVGGPESRPFRPCQNAAVGRSRSLRALLVATTVAGVSLPHLIAGEVAGSLPALFVGVIVGLGCLRVALVAGSRSGRIVGALGVAVAALAPLLAYLAQEVAEREPGLEAGHAEPSFLAAVLAQAPLIVLGLIAVRLLVAAVRMVAQILGPRAFPPGRRRPRSIRTPSFGSLIPRLITSSSSNGERAPPFSRAPYRMAPLD
jgi:hypothetical protein